MKPLIIIGAGGLLAWYLYSKGYFAGLFPATTTAPPVTTSPPPAGTVNPATGTTPNPNSLAAIFGRLKTDAGAQAASTGLSAWGWNYSLARVSSVTPPDPSAIWPSGIDPTQNMTADQYWAIVSPYLATTYGMSGIRGMRGVGVRQVLGGWAA